MGLYFTIAFRNLLQAKRRTLLLGSAIALVTFIHIALQSISNGYMEGLVDGATSLAAGHLNVVGLHKHNMARMYPLLNESNRVAEIINSELEGEVVSVVDRNSTVGQMVGEKRSIFLFIQGITLANESKLKKVMRPAQIEDAQGNISALGSFEALEKPNTVILFEYQAEKLGVTVGDTVLMNSQTLMGTNVVSLTVGAIMEDVGMISRLFTFASRETIQDLMHLDDEVGARVLVYLKDREHASETLPRVREALLEEGFQLTEYQSSSLMRRWMNLQNQDWLGQRLDVTTWEDDLSDAKVVIDSIRSVSYVLLTILSIIIAIGIMNTMWISARERTNEVGCIRAIGMGSKHVLLLFMLEAMILGFIGSLFGASVGYVLVQTISALEIPIHNEAMRIILFANKINLDISFVEMLVAVVAFSLVTAIAALFPSIKAARIQPIQAINHID